MMLKGSFIKVYFMNRPFIHRALFAVLLLMALLMTPHKQAFAQTASMSVNPSSQTVNVGDAFSVTIGVNPGGVNVNTAEVHLSYNPAFVQVTSLTAGSALPLVVQSQFDNTAGQADFAAGIAGSSVNTSFTLVTINFTAISPAVNTPLTIRRDGIPNQSQVLRTSDATDILTTVSNGTVTINGPTATPTNTPVPPTPTNTFTPAPPTNTPTNTPIPPTPTNTFTPAPPTNTPTSTLTPTPTLTPTSTNTVGPGTPTNTMLPPTETPTPTLTSTFTPAPPTNTPPPGATNTNTPVPGATATNTPIPGAPTNTPVPGATNTPALPAPTSAPGAGTAPLCPDFSGATNTLVRAIIPPNTATAPGRTVNIYCRILSIPAEISVPRETVLAAVEVFALSTDGQISVTVFNNSMRVCLLGAGALLFRDANGAPRITREIGSFISGSYTCGDIPNAGTVILVARAGIVTPTPVPPLPIPQPSGLTHIVQRGENLFRISLRYGVSLNALAAINGIRNPALIFVGQVLIIPAGGSIPVPTATPTRVIPTPTHTATPTRVPGATATPTPTPAPAQRTHTVQPGENLFRISLRYGLDWRVVAAANNIANPRLIYPGQVLIIPGG
jgi:LysM repeat protein